jgi:hypothetical protein
MEARQFENIEDEIKEAKKTIQENNGVEGYL